MRLAQLILQVLLVISGVVIVMAMILTVSMLFAGVTVVFLASKLTGRELPSPLLPD